MLPSVSVFSVLSVVNSEKRNTEGTKVHRGHRETRRDGLRTTTRKCGSAADERNFGYSAAHEAIPVPLLPSGPGGVRGTSSHRARSSTHRQSRVDSTTAKEV